MLLTLSTSMNIQRERSLNELLLYADDAEAVALSIIQQQLR